MIGSKTPVQVLHQMDRLNMSEMEALDALEALRRAAA